MTDPPIQQSGLSEGVQIGTQNNEQQRGMRANGALGLASKSPAQLPQILAPEQGDLAPE